MNEFYFQMIAQAVTNISVRIEELTAVLNTLTKILEEKK